MTLRKLAAGFVSLCAFAAPPVQATDDEDVYIDGNLLFLGYHEVGHLLLDVLLDFDQHKERFTAEEIADDIATWLMLPDPDETEQDEEIIAAIEGWIDSALSAEQIRPNPHYPDDIERAARIACHVYGSNPQVYNDLAEIFVDADQAQACVTDFNFLKDDMDAWFADFVRGNDEAGAINIDYSEAPADLEEARTYLMQSAVLEDIAEDITDYIGLPVDIRIEARSCGGGAAEFRYNTQSRLITACYEAVDWFMGYAPTEMARQQSLQEGDFGVGSGGVRVKQRPPPS